MSTSLSRPCREIWTGSSQRRRHGSQWNTAPYTRQLHRKADEVADLKIVLVGGGSFAWTPRLTANILDNRYLDGAEVVLFDLNPEALAGIPSGRAPNR